MFKLSKPTLRTPFASLLALLLIAGAFHPASAAPEMKFDVLQIGTETLSNVTVTTTNSEYVFLLHSKGMGNYKVAALPPEVLVKLGYPPPKSQTNSVAAWARETVTQLNAEQIQQVEEKLLTQVPPGLPDLARQNPLIVAAIAGGLLLSHLLFSYCCMLICRKTSTEPGFLVWLPILQLIPLLKAARMSPVWALAFLIPLLNIVAQVVWSFKIAKARGFGAGLGILLLLPLVNCFAFLYLAFAGAAATSAEEPPKRRVQELMTLETA